MDKGTKIMRTTKYILCTGMVMMAVSAGSAFAGPVGMGLHHTEEHSRAYQKKHTVKVAVDLDCASRALAAVKGHADVRKAAYDGERIDVVLHTTKAVDEKAAGVRAVVNNACGAA